MVYWSWLFFQVNSKGTHLRPDCTRINKRVTQGASHPRTRWLSFQIQIFGPCAVSVSQGWLLDVEVCIEKLSMTTLHGAILRGDIDAVRRLCDEGAAVDEVDATQKQTPLMVAASLGSLEIVWQLMESRADTSLRDEEGNSALDLARARGHADVVSLLDGGTSLQHQHAVPDFDSDDEVVLPAEEPGHVVVFEHVVQLSITDLAGFAWSRYERGISKLAGVDISCVWVTPEPGSAGVDLRTTVIKRLRAEEATSPAGIEEVMATIKSLQRRQPLQQAAGGNAPVSLATVKLRGEAHDAAAAVSAQAKALAELRPQYDELRDNFEATSAEPSTRAREASRAILLLRPAREAIAQAAEQAAKAASLRRKRMGVSGGK